MHLDNDVYKVIISCMSMKMIYTSLSAICIYEIYVYMCDMSMIWILIQVYMMFCLNSISIVDSSILLGGIGSALSKVRDNLSVGC